MTFQSQSVHQSHASKESVVSSRKNTGQNYGVDDASCSVGASHLKDDGEWRCASFLGVKVGVGVWDVEADQENREEAANVSIQARYGNIYDILKKDNTPKDILDHLRQVPGRILGLTGRDGDTLSSSVCWC